MLYLDKVTLSLDTSREDGVREVAFRISHRPDIKYERVRELSITYDDVFGRCEARLVVEVKARENKGTGRVAVGLGEMVLMACAFDDGTIMLYSGRQIKAIRRYWQKARASLQQNFRRWKEISHGRGSR